MTTPLLSAHGLCHAWPGHTLFDQLSFALPPGLTLLLGGDGVGEAEAQEREEKAFHEVRREAAGTST